MTQQMTEMLRQQMAMMREYIDRARSVLPAAAANMMTDLDEWGNPVDKEPAGKTQTELGGLE